MPVTRNTTSAREVFGNLRGTCHHCGKPLKRISVDLFGKQTEVPCWGSCGCEESRWDGEDVTQDERRWARAGVPKRYLHAECDLGGYPQSVASGRSLYVHGPYGSGKTFFACALAKRLVDMGVSVRFENSRHLMTEIQGIFGGRSTDALDRAHNCRVLVLDDLGKEQATEFAISMLYELVDGRYMQGKPTVVTSNFSRGELMTRLCARDAATAESIVSRLCENADTLLMDGEDRRLA